MFVRCNDCRRDAVQTLAQARQDFEAAKASADREHTAAVSEFKEKLAVANSETAQFKGKSEALATELQAKAGALHSTELQLATASAKLEAATVCC